MKKVLVIILVLIAVAVWWLPRLDRYQQAGEIVLPSLSAEVEVVRSSDGVPYIHADSLNDAFTAQGFLFAQDRLFQMEFLRYVAQGRLAELIGDRGLGNDRLVRIIDIPGFARRHVARISERERNYLQRYADGVNDYIASREDEFPLMLGVMGHTPAAWQIEDMLSIQFFGVWSSSVNWKQELLTLRLIDALGGGRAHQLRPLAVNPDDPRTEYHLPDEALAATALGISVDSDYFSSDWTPRVAMGSNAWASDGQKSAGGKPILSNDPHLDARMLPGFWYPMGLITPVLRAVGTASPGVPGLGVARTADIAYGATNGYADVVDIFVERVDPDNPDNYLEGEQSRPFEARSEVLRIADKESEQGYRTETLIIRQTPRGPVISDHGMEVVADKVLTLRWSVPEYAGADLGNLDLLLAKDVEEAVAAVGKAAQPLNYVLVDKEGNIARAASGMVPERIFGNGLIPQTVTAEDNWRGRIPADEMPLQLNPQKGWVGSANHRVTDYDYPYAYSTHFAGDWRYRRLMELMEKPTLSSDDHWAANHDIKNLLAHRMRPALIEVFNAEPALQPMAALLEDWDLMDDKALAAPLVFQVVLRQFALATFSDDLPEDLLADYLEQPYYWQQRLVAWYEQGFSDWFDDTRTPEVESRDDIIRRAGELALAELNTDWGNDPKSWRWGDAHTITFAHPFIPGERAANLIGGGTHPYSGSGETLMRALYLFNKPYATKVNDSLRIIVDMADEDKIAFHFPGGVSERWFDPRNKNFLEAYLSGEKRYLWFSDAAIDENADSRLNLRP